VLGVLAELSLCDSPIAAVKGALYLWFKVMR
jgi:hypothetical protein